MPLGTPDAQAPYVLNCTSPSPVFAQATARRQAGEALMRAAQQLRPVLERIAS